jgi:hypothetical protein
MRQASPVDETDTFRLSVPSNLCISARRWNKCDLANFPQGMDLLFASASTTAADCRSPRESCPVRGLQARGEALILACQYQIRAARLGPTYTYPASAPPLAWISTYLMALTAKK